ncbi:MAG: acyl-CoA dehydrogenase [Rhodospirillaceae bacterium]|jgi:alkylation response protein AidB-like acyl-CoA dehydrogenase|nr:acyl-CoA dehydrogenase [Rhodospirillaceae bacterium]MBT5194991.1 acyl-CoA dehydrogenase [Rhodospirillaceae bacterium]MBT5898158.1 acyl-CoA dehydrogenase [Rhodospirillaceae bacterium]MBT6430141.1 acyl-CoA dehydrogenase [Rhodospirillaceae bacterium]
MDFSDTAAEAAFRAEARAWLDANVTPKAHPNQTWASVLEDKSRANIVRLCKAFQKKRYDDGWACLHWPREYGGRGCSAIERVIFGQEEVRYIVPRGVVEIGQGMAGPILMKYATDEQKNRYLPPMAKGEEIWCQIFSEATAGSDLAGLRMSAVRDGDDWILNGEKIWTSGADYSDFGITVARSDPDVAKHKGLTFFFIDMTTPGLSIEPIRQISGSSNFNAVRFDDVRVPDHQRLGDVGHGWKVALATLMNERVSVGEAPGPDFEQIFALAQNVELDGRPAIEDQAVRAQLAQWYCETAGLKNTRMRSISALSRGETPGPENSIAKLVSARKAQEIAFFGTDLMDQCGIVSDLELVPGDGRFQQSVLQSPGMRIAGGTDEILRNIIAERVLGLPQEPRPDKGLTFRQIPNGQKK